MLRTEPLPLLRRRNAAIERFEVAAAAAAAKIGIVRFFLCL